MESLQATAAYILEHCRRYPLLEPRDLLKGLHQSTFGCGHLVCADGDGLERLRTEAATLAEVNADGVELLDGDFCRVPLGLLQTGMRAETLFRLFCLSAEKPCGSVDELEERLAVSMSLAEEGKLPFPAADLQEEIRLWKAAGYPACRHSECFRELYAPAYRVIRKEYARLIPLLAAIDRGLAEKGKLLVAIEGGAGSGKSTLGQLLERIYDCALFHADDYFLQPHQRTPERLAEVGGNLDRERLEEEILRPLKNGEAVVWRRYDCCSQSLCAEEEVSPKALTILEGAYSMHPDLAGYYDLSAFLRMGPELQAQRIRRRNSPEMAERFFNIWIPMERRYFEQMHVESRCDLILEVEA